MKVSLSKLNPPLGGLLVINHIKATAIENIDIKWGEDTTVGSYCCKTSNDVARAMVKVACPELYGNNAKEKAEVDHWLTFTLGHLSHEKNFFNTLQVLNERLAPVTYLALKRLTIADYIVFAALYVNKHWQEMLNKNSVPIHILRWYKFIKSQEVVKETINELTEEQIAALFLVQNQKQNLEKYVTASGRAREGKFEDLPGVETGNVIVRFPPEASGYLHIGHAKAALLNQYYQETFKGKLIMRFDDTNPAKENAEFEKVILEDVAMLELKPDYFTHTSQYFDLMLEYCEKMIKEGKAYVDDTEAELMRQQREQKIDSVNRNNSVAKNLQIWEEMKKGSETGQRYCVRAKIDMQSVNGCMRDPTIYRCKNEVHPRTGDKYKVYPTYDFACPIVDAVEGVTHTLRTMEYRDRDPQFYWFIEALGLRKPYIWEYSRLSMTNTVLSKRKLTWFVQEGLVDGWDDPRMPTVRGVLRRGMTVAGLKEFIIAQGSSKSVVFMEWDKIWAFNKKVIDPIAPRFTAVEYTDPVPVLVKNVGEECLIVPKHPKNIDVGQKEVWIGPRLLIDRADAELLKEGENATFINWGNLMIKKVNRNKNRIVSVEAEPNLANKDYKKTLKLTWLAETDKAKFTPTYCVYFDHLISKPLIGKDEDFKQFINPNTRKEVQVLGDPELRKLKKGDIIQLQRKGFFRVDVAYEPISLYSCREQSVILFYVPDGHKESPLESVKENQLPTKQTTEGLNGTHLQVLANSAEEMNRKIIEQGNIVRDLKSKQAAKNDVENALKILLFLKAEYKHLTNEDWKPDCVLPKAVDINEDNLTQKIQNQTDEVLANSAEEVNRKIIEQGNIVRDLKSKKAAKSDVDNAVQILLSLKAEYKRVTNEDWKPGCVPPKAVDSNDNLELKVQNQADKVRKLKSEKADKSVVTAEVNVLLQLKADYKKKMGKDWIASMTSIVTSNPKVTLATDLLQQISDHGNKVRELKTNKADKTVIDAEVKTLLELKEQYKARTGQEWKADLLASAIKVESVVEPPHTNQDKSSLNSLIISQSKKVRQLKAEKPDKSRIDSETKLLLQYKSDFKNLTGKDWQPDNKLESQVTNDEAPKFGDVTKEILTNKITQQGNLVRDLKSKKSDKSQIDDAVKILLDLKAEYQKVTGEEFTASDRVQNKQKTKEPKSTSTTKEKVTKQKPIPKKKNSIEVEENAPKKQTRLGLEAAKEDSLPEWYSQVITKGEMIEYYDVSGCYIFRPWSFTIWEAIKDWFDAEIKKIGVQNCYFPIFVSKNVLEKEKTHIADFAPEVAWVTKSGDSDLAEPIAVRPTSETVMYPAYAKWIQSYRDLPIKLNQWNNVVRWEFKHPQPFLRTREFLWQEGHTAHASKWDADEEVRYILDLYGNIYEDLLAIPVIKGRKTEKEKFAGADYTLTVEAFVSASGRGIQGATSHHLGQNFSKMFEIIYEDPETQEKKFVYQNSWGITTRTIGVMIMIHADNQGLVLPPRVASIQAVIVPCGISTSLSDDNKKKLQSCCDNLEKALKEANLRVKGDYRQNYSPGWKFNHWELKGVPIRIELGPKDVEKQQFVAVRRDTGEKIVLPLATAAEKVAELLQNIHDSLFKKASEDFKSHTVLLKEWVDFPSNLDKRNVILAPFCGLSECEDKIKADSARDKEAEPGAPSMGAKSLCIPLEQPELIKPNDKCIHPECDRKPKYYTLFGRSY
ncbi:bifunctional glutamate/proline--tRNA ligase [Cylas formicarius]|uniref:bifunctional glutamate/proline--tRNA ligase n=1 Tax=Cylas formicarius TaxID=197179 RepID=UPI0029589010|nr:bifunctional glutamate/proline--tRNA ligase [Cylas formicarius]